MKQCCLILGAKSDIGEAIAYQFAGHGYDLILCARGDADRLSIMANDLMLRYKCNARTEYFDALDFDSHDSFYNSLPVRPDIVVSVFGYLGNQKDAQVAFAESKLIIESNFIGHVSILNIVANEFEKRKNGTIIGVSSVAGDKGRQSNYIYGAAKGAYSLYLQGLRNRLSKSNVQVITVKPGYVDTKMTAHLSLTPFLTADPKQVAINTFKAYTKKKNVIYVLPLWRLIMLVIIHIPEFLFKKMSL